MNIIKVILLGMFVFVATEPTFAGIKYVGGYSRSDGQYVQGHYKDTSGDGYSYNNRREMWGY